MKGVGVSGLKGLRAWAKSGLRVEGFVLWCFVRALRVLTGGGWGVGFGI